MAFGGILQWREHRITAGDHSGQDPVERIPGTSVNRADFPSATHRR